MMSKRCFILFLLLALVLPVVRANRLLKRKPQDHHKLCVCASDIISCSNVSLTKATFDFPQHTVVLDLSFNSITQLLATWMSTDLNQLQTLLLNNNNLTFLSSEAFVHTTRLRYLDLSSNRLTLLDEFIFEPLEKLEILLLFNNCISQIDRSAFHTMVALQKLYLSHNKISRFPVEVLKERSQELSPFKQCKKDSPFKLLDVSFNRIKVLPVKELRAMRAWLKKGVYFHNNTLTCSCELHDLVAYWHLRELSSVSDFADSHTCNMPGKQNEKILKLNCSEVKNLKKEGYLEETMFLDCDTRHKYMAKRWVLPGNMSANSSNVLNGTFLKIEPLKVEDSGVYTCYATNDSLSDTLHITVVVFNCTKRCGLEDLKTAYTTLGTCVVSLVLILVYLYVTPRCCSFCSGGNTEKDDTGESLHSSTVSLPLAYGEQGAEAAGFAFSHGDVQESKNGRLNPIGEDD
ncbi:amphoterin-induced protein 1-like [Poecilia latipinna]|uniref:amphoterin-induced protein 1-like n=1 Tax=Poecilia latipinna TaxID=48699 RepID=UPI00072E8062|nr:PREDICTED: amphoterin-induced protein 1-like [Poecilia latipinna]